MRYLREAFFTVWRASARRRSLTVGLLGVFCAVLAVAGAMGAVRYISTFWFYRGFPAPSVPRTVNGVGPHGARRARVELPAVQTIKVRSAALGGYSDQVYVVLPPGYARHPRQRYPVLYLLHGFPGLPQALLNIGEVATTEATLVAGGRMKPIIIVMPTGSRSFLMNHEWANGIGTGNNWQSFVAFNLVKAIDARYRTISRARGRGIGGLSEGGYGALNIGLHHAGEFGLLESWSGYMRADRKPAVFGHSPRVRAYNSPAVWLVSVGLRLRVDHIYVWFYIGAQDPLAAQNQAFAAELTALGVAHRFFEVPGKHDWRLWRSQMPQALITASEHLSHG